MIEHRPSDTLRGIALVVLTSSLFAVVDAFSKILTETQAVAQVVCARYAFALVILLATTRPTALGDLFRTQMPHFQILRAIGPICVSTSMVLAVHYLPLAEATVILFAAPFIVVVFAGPVLGERVHPSSWIGVAVGFFAIALVARPGFSSLSQYIVFPFAAAVFYAIFQLATRAISTRGERPRTTLAWTVTTGAAISTPIAALTWEPVAPETWILIIGLGVTFYLAQWLVVWAYAHASAGTLAPFAYTQVAAATIIGIFVFDAVPDVWTILGVVLIVGAGVYVARNQG